MVVLLAAAEQETMGDGAYEESEFASDPVLDDMDLSGGFPQRCKVCLRPSELDFRVSDETWARVVPEPYRNLVVCLGCFDAFASQRGVAYAHDVGGDLNFCGQAGILCFKVIHRHSAPGLR